MVLGESWREEDVSLMDLIIKLRHYNKKILIEQWVSADDKNSTVNIIKVRRVYSSTVFSFFMRIFLALTEIGCKRLKLNAEFHFCE